MTTPFQQALAHCASEKIQHSGRIQAYAALVVFNDELTVLQASDNCATFFDCPTQSVVGQPLTLLIGEHNASLFEGNKLQQLLDNPTTFQAIDFPLWINSNTRRFKINLRLFRQAHAFIAECTLDDWSANRYPVADNTPTPPSVALLGRTDLLAFLQGVAQEIQQFSGYDRVMIYQFEWNWDGQVVAEAVIAGKQSFLGLYFPASDIPEQARRLYSQNTFNMLVDTDADSVAISPAADAACAQPLDLSRVICRSFSPVHVQYLKNMGVRASLSIPILVEGHLWGLIACHHYQPKQLSMPLRKACTLIGQTISHKISQLTASAERDNCPTLNPLLQTLRQCINPPVLTEAIITPLLAFMQASSAIINVEGRVYCVGQPLSDAHQATLLAWVQAQPAAEYLACPAIAELHPDLAALSPTVCGLLATPLNPALPYGVLWLRPERITDRLWGGQHQPDDVIFDDNQGYVMRPRQSFAAWEAQQRHHAQPWEPYLIRHAQALSVALLNTLANTGY